MHIKHFFQPQNFYIFLTEALLMSTTTYFWWDASDEHHNIMFSWKNKKKIFSWCPFLSGAMDSCKKNKNKTKTTTKKKKGRHVQKFMVIYHLDWINWINEFIESMILSMHIVAIESKILIFVHYNSTVPDKQLFSPFLVLPRKHCRHSLEAPCRVTSNEYPHLLMEK